MWLIADIGGTKTLVGLFSQSLGRFIDVKRFENDDYVGIESILSDFIKNHSGISIDKALLVAAGPVETDQTGQVFVQMTNRPWRIDGSLLPGIEVFVKNDFFAITMACATWSKACASQDIPKQIIPLTPERQATWPATVGVIGAGTGLGQAFAIPHPSFGWNILPSEGGHCGFAAHTERQLRLVDWFWKKQGKMPEYEDFISGPGLARLYDFLHQESGRPPRHPEIEKMGSFLKGLPKVIVSLGMNQTDALCSETLLFFTELYGEFAAHMMLEVLPLGGVFLGGGLAPRMLPLLETGPFLTALSRKNHALLKKIPLFVVMDDLATIQGGADWLKASLV